MRKSMFLLTLLGGLTLAVLGFFLSAPIGPPIGPEISDPRLEFAPAIFVLGVVLVFSSAIVYELTPD